MRVDIPLEKIAKIAASPRTDHEFICVYRGMLTGDPLPNKCEIEAGVFFPPAVVDGWTSARPEDFAPGFLECWKTCRERVRSDNEQFIRPEIFSAVNDVASSS